MENKNYYKYIKYLIGAIILALGITLSLLSNVGAGAFDALNFSISKLLSISVGTAMYLTIFTIFTLAMILKPRVSYIFGFLLSLMTGFWIDVWMRIIPGVNGLLGGIIFFAIALILLPLGIALMIKSKMPLSPMDTLMLIMAEKTKKSISMMKTLMEVSFVILALIFGYYAGIGIGSISIGTVVLTFSIGPLIQIFLKLVK